MIKVGTKIEFKSGMQYEVIKVFSQNLVDLRACKPQFEWMPDYFPVYYSIELKEYKILSNEPKVVRNDEQKEKNCSMKSVGCSYLGIPDFACEHCKFLE